MTFCDPQALASTPTQWICRLVQASPLVHFFQSSIVIDGLKVVLMTLLYQVVHHLLGWFSSPSNLTLTVSATFYQHDAAYLWLVRYLANRGVWKNGTREFIVLSRTRKQRAAGDEFATPRFALNDSMDYIPALEYVQRFFWNGYLAQVKFVNAGREHLGNIDDIPPPSLILTLYTWNVSVLDRLIAEALESHRNLDKRCIGIHTIVLNRNDMPVWSEARAKILRPFESLILDQNVQDMFTDVEQFLDPKTESWYHKKGVPYHRGYLLYGPPGSGKTSTVHALASRFDLEVYVVSISGAKISDVSLGKLISSIPKGAILLIEDIDCIFPPSFRNDSTRLDPHGLPLSDPFEGQSRVTLSGMLNMLDGAASENGRIVFATTNHLEALDPALIRAGRFDVKVEYKLASPEQGIALFRHFFPESDAATAETFAKAIPLMELSMADISGYLIKYRDATLEKTVADAAEWARREVSGKCRLKCLQTEGHSLRSESSDLGARTLFSCSPNFSMSPNVEKRNLDSPLRDEVQVAEDEAGYLVEDSERSL